MASYLHRTYRYPSKKIIIGTRDRSAFVDWHKLEEKHPSARKFIDDHIIYQSRPFSHVKGMSLIQPDIWRAPEVVLGMKWTSKVDICNVGTLVWDLFEDHRLFDGRCPNKQHSEEHLLAEMTAILGNPPTSFLRKCPEGQKYWNEWGQWTGQAVVPDGTLEDSEEYMEGRAKDMFLQFMRKMLQWDPEKRQSARELLEDPWLTS